MSTPPAPSVGSPGPDTPEDVLVQDLPSFTLRLLLREHVRIIIGAGVIAGICFAMPSTPWWWMPIKYPVGLLSLFVLGTRVLQMNAVRQELRRRAGEPAENDG